MRLNYKEIWRFSLSLVELNGSLNFKTSLFICWEWMCLTLGHFLVLSRTFLVSPKHRIWPTQRFQSSNLVRNVYPWWNLVSFQALATLVRIIVPWRRNYSMGHKIPIVLPSCQDFVSESGSLESYNQVSIYFSYMHNGAHRMVDLNHWKYVSFDFSSKGIIPFS